MFFLVSGSVPVLDAGVEVSCVGGSQCEAHFLGGGHDGGEEGPDFFLLVFTEVEGEGEFGVVHDWDWEEGGIISLICH